jgi:hypothetical protein
MSRLVPVIRVIINTVYAIFALRFFFVLTLVYYGWEKSCERHHQILFGLEINSSRHAGILNAFVTVFVERNMVV